MCAKLRGGRAIGYIRVLVFQTLFQPRRLKRTKPNTSPILISASTLGCTKCPRPGKHHRAPVNGYQRNVDEYKRKLQWVIKDKGGGGGYKPISSSHSFLTRSI